MRIFLLVIALLLQSCASLSPWPSLPTVSLQNVQLAQTNATSTRLLFDLAISNPNALALPIEGIQYELRLNGHRVVEGVSGSISSIPAFGTLEVQIETRADLVGMFSLVSSLVAGSARQVDYELDTRLSVQGLWRPIQLVDSGSLPLGFMP